VTLPVSRKAQREQAREVQKAEKAAKSASPSGNTLLKRKRSDVNESDPKLKEFLEVMRPKSTSKTWISEDSQEQEPPRKVQALELPEAESDSEYEIVPKKAKKQATPAPTTLTAPSLAFDPVDKAEPLESGQEEPQSTQPEPVGGLQAADDDEWLRSRTSRLLDLVDPADVVTQNAPADDSKPPIPPEESAASPVDGVPAAHEDSSDKVMQDDTPQDEADPTIEAIRTSGRLFVRNLA
jgi:multiple RNA-binding domain-containing protein 1